MDASADLSQLSIDQLLLLLHSIWFELHNRLHSASTRRSEPPAATGAASSAFSQSTVVPQRCDQYCDWCGDWCTRHSFLIIDTTVVTSTDITVDELRISW